MDTAHARRAVLFPFRRRRLASEAATSRGHTPPPRIAVLGVADGPLRRTGPTQPSSTRRSFAGFRGPMIRDSSTCQAIHASAADLSRRCRHRTERLFGLEMPRQSSVKPAAASLKPAGEPSPWGQLRLSQPLIDLIEHGQHPNPPEPRHLRPWMNRERPAKTAEASAVVPPRDSRCPPARRYGQLWPRPMSPRRRVGASPTRLRCMR
jgi:hypothetical protein